MSKQTARALRLAAILPAVGGCLWLLGGALSAGPGGDGQDAPKGRIAYRKGRRIAVLANKRIDESSGMACGRVNKGVFWTHNDSGDEPRLFAFNAAGEHLATCDIEGARARDWEDMCSFIAGKRGVLLIGDVGDNTAQRSNCTLYAVNEPRLKPGRKGASLSAEVAQTVHFRYADGPHNCESIGWDPTARTVYIVTKIEAGSCKVYALPWPKRPGRKPVVVKAIATLDVPTTSAMDISPDGRRAVVLTYGPAYEYVRAAGQSWAEAFAARPRALPMPDRRQGESICYGADGVTLYLTSEGVPAPLLEVAPVKPATKPAATAPSAARSPAR